MSERMSHPFMLVALVIVLLATVLAAQGLTDGMATPTSAGGTTQVVGRAGFAYLTGLRVFVAQVLWNRIEPIFHEYYSGVALEEQQYMLTTFDLVTRLDPQFEQPYYVGPWILARSGHAEAAIELARKGVENAPRSGLLRSSYAQILMLFGNDLTEAVAQADVAFGPDVTWTDPVEQHDAYGAVRAVYIKAGLNERADAVLSRIEELDASIGDAIPSSGHDHNGDGVPDH